MSKFKLEDDFFDEVLFIGISTSLKDYQLSFFINKSLYTNFKKMLDFSGDYFSKKEKSLFSFYYFKNNDLFSEYFLLSNKCNNTSLLLSGYKQANFFLIIKSNVMKGKTAEIITTLRKIKNIFLAFNIEISNIKNINTLLNEIDYHIEICNNPKQISKNQITDLN